MPPAGFQEVQRAEGVDPEISKRIAGRPVVRGLRGGMNDRFDLGAKFCEKAINAFALADIDREMAVVFELLLEGAPAGHRGCLWPKEFAAHIVVDTGDFESFLVKTFAGFRAD